MRRFRGENPSRRSLGGYTAAFLIASFSACSGEQSKSSTPAAIPVHTATVERRTLASFETLDGQVDPFLQASLAPQQSGTLVAVYANEGDHVRKDAVLAKIDDSLLKANLAQQEGARGQSVAKLAQSQIQVPITDVSFREAVVQAEKSLVQARQQLITDQADVVNTKLTYDADRSLLQQGYVSATAYQQARAAFVSAKQTEAGDTEKLAQADAALRSARQNLGNSALQRQIVAENRAAVEQSAGSVQQSQTAVTQTTITAPFDGVVTARSLDPGAFAGPSQAIFQISQVDPAYVDFNVKDTDLAYVSPGTLVSFATSAHPERRYSGTVASVNAVPTIGTLLYRARIIKANPDYSLRGGLEVSVRVTKEQRRDVLTVPRAAVAQNGPAGVLFVVEHPDAASGSNAVVKQLTVKLGMQSNDYVEVSGSGVRAGAAVVLGITDNLRDGSKVTVTAR